MMDTPIKLVAFFLIGVVLVASFPHLGTGRSTDFLPGWWRRILLFASAILPPLLIIFGAMAIMRQPFQGKDYVIESGASSPGGKSLDGVVAKVLARLAVVPNASLTARDNLEWCRSVLVAKETWESKIADPAPLGDECVLAARETVVLACLYRNNPRQILINVGQNPNDRKRWAILQASLVPRFKKVVKLDYDTETAKAITTNITVNAANDSRTGFTLSLVSGNDAEFDARVQSLIRECTNREAPSQAWRMMNHLSLSGPGNSACTDLIAVTGQGWLGLCAKQDQELLRKAMDGFNITVNTQVSIGYDGGDALLEFDPQTWAGLALSGVSTPLNWTGYKAEVVTSDEHPFILTARHPDRAVILINKNFIGFTDRPNALMEKDSALARAALMRSIDRLGAELGAMKNADNETIKALDDNYVGPYLTQHELEELFGDAQRNTVLTAIVCFVLALFIAVVHAALLILPSPTPPASRFGR